LNFDFVIIIIPKKLNKIKTGNVAPRKVCFHPSKSGYGKMAAPTEFTLESVRAFMLERGGKVTNHELVKHFKQFLTDPYTKGN
jgi:hypothetical protein